MEGTESRRSLQRVDLSALDLRVVPEGQDQTSVLVRARRRPRGRSDNRSAAGGDVRRDRDLARLARALVHASGAPDPGGGDAGDERVRREVDDRVVPVLQDPPLGRAEPEPLRDGERRFECACPTVDRREIGRRVHVGELPGIERHEPAVELGDRVSEAELPATEPVES